MRKKKSPYISKALDPEYNSVRECKVFPDYFGKGLDGVKFFSAVTYHAKSLKKLKKV